MKTCSICGKQGHGVEALTLEAQITPARLSRIADRDGWRFCTATKCEVVYFRGSETVPLHEIHTIPFQKSHDPERLVCFCFEHSVGEVEADLIEHGTSTIRTSIKAACKAGRDDCARKNPQGRCCLGNIGAVVHAMSEAGAVDKKSVDPSEESPVDCCTPRSTEPPQPSPSSERSARTGGVAIGAALVAAVLSSTCCWLPLAAIALGASSAGVGAFFEVWRLPMLLVTAGLLGGGFYLTYRRPRCAPGEACEVPNPRLKRINRQMLWITTVLVAAFAFFPVYVSAFTGGGGEIAAAAPQQTDVHYTVAGMTCAGCEAHAREAIERIPGVVSVAVSHQDGSAQVIWSGTPNHSAVSTAIAEFGYRAHPFE